MSVQVLFFPQQYQYEKKEKKSEQKEKEMFQ